MSTDKHLFKIKWLNYRIQDHLFTSHCIRIEPIVLCFVLQNMLTNENDVGQSGPVFYSCSPIFCRKLKHVSNCHKISGSLQGHIRILTVGLERALNGASHSAIRQKEVRHLMLFTQQKSYQFYTTEVLFQREK